MLLWFPFSETKNFDQLKSLEMSSEFKNLSKVTRLRQSRDTISTRFRPLKIVPRSPTWLMCSPVCEKNFFAHFEIFLNDLRNGKSVQNCVVHLESVVCTRFNEISRFGNFSTRRVGRSWFLSSPQKFTPPTGIVQDRTKEMQKS